jgi:hypothetical protein
VLPHAADALRVALLDHISTGGALPEGVTVLTGDATGRFVNDVAAPRGDALPSPHAPR